MLSHVTQPGRGIETADGWAVRSTIRPLGATDEAGEGSVFAYQATGIIGYKKRFCVQRIIGSGDLWITEYILTYDGKPSYTVSIMEFTEDKVARETQYFADPFEAGPWRAAWVERLTRT